MSNNTNNIIEIAGGNSTALIPGLNRENRNDLTKKLLRIVEQVGYFSTEMCPPRLEMMGNELSVNGTIAFASTLANSGKITTSGLKTSVKYFNKGKTTTIDLSIKIEQVERIILLEGIGYLVSNSAINSANLKNKMEKMCERYCLPAFGLIKYSGNKILPTIYVKETGSLVEESACGSGSIAFSYYQGIRQVVQPTGKTISVIINQDSRSVQVSTETSSSNQTIKELIQ